MESLVEVSDQEVRIDFMLNCKSRANVRLRSLCATSPVAFKVQTSSPDKFMVNPPSGVIPPLSCATLQIILKPQAQLPQSYPRSPSDRFLIKTAHFPGPAHHPEPIASWFASRPTTAPPTQDHKLKVAFVGPFLLRHAVRRGDHDTARNILKRQKSVLSELPPRESESLLRVATELADPEGMMNLLLESGLKIGARVGPDDARASRGWDALHVAAALNRTDEVVELVRMMRGRGSLDRGDRKGRTPLHVAAGKGHIRCAKVLVESGADKDTRSRDGRTALHRAAANGDRPMVEMLMEMGADPTIPNERGRLPVDVARDKGHAPWLLACVGAQWRPDICRTRARRSRKWGGSLEGVCGRLAPGDWRHRGVHLTAERRRPLWVSSPTPREGSRRRSLTFQTNRSICASKIQNQVVEILERGEAVLMAARRGDSKHLKSLLETGATISHRDQYGLTALHASAVKGHKDVLLILIEFGSDLESRDNEGHSPLHLAVVGGSLDTVVALVSKGANVNIKSNRSATPLYMATTMGHHDIAEFLITKGASSSS
ncbi:hypothetical protein TIFTF001_010472 [Ficus carica]|uniref:MSP domain-containing protein n=1 Tax=Ficus carica TaxID=3494 RepID=A0AA88CZV9_FICCA|nr:hypothetical protein TIFTF001_010472 [Ficus carica]